MIELRVLGPISLKRADGSDVTPILAQPKRLALAAYLAAPPPLGGRCFHRKDTLVAMFWPELDQQRARAALRNALYFLRQCLGPTVLLSRGEEGVGLDPNKLWCDLEAFDVAVRLRDHSTAFQLYRGTVLDGVFVSDARPFEEWLDGQRMRRSSEAQEAAAQASRRHAAAGRLAEALTWARRARAMAPLNEDAARLVIALRFLNGDPAGAMDEYSRFEALLRTEHDASPGRETQRLIEAVRAPNDDAAAFASAVAELPLRAPASRRPSSVPVKFPPRFHDRAVFEAFVQVRLGLARRHGERVALVLVTPEGASPAGSVSECATVAPLDSLAQSVMNGVRSADLVARFADDTLVVLPAEEGAADVNALVGRLRAHLRRASDAANRTPDGAEVRVSAIWLDPALSESAVELLADAAQE